MKTIAGQANAPSPFNVRVTTKVVKNFGGVWSAVWDTSALFCKVYASLTRDIMIQNVSPGRGPGPHPHRTPHEDTGWAAKGITIRQKPKGLGGVSPAWFAGAFSDRTVGRTRAARGRSLKTSTPPWLYLFYLEFGWRSASGARFRYPWAEPAYRQASQHKIGKVSGPKGIYISSGGKS